MFHQTKVAEKIKTYVLCLTPPPENRADYEIMWKNVVEPGRQQVTIWLMRSACWIPKVTKHTLRMCNTYCFSTVLMVA